MSASHDHHHHGPNSPTEVDSSTRRRLAIAFFLTAGFLAAEVVGGILSGSLALLSDAAHMLTDAGALGMAWLAANWAAREPTKRHSFGLYRAEVLAALLNGVLLLFIVWEIVHEAIERIDSPRDVKAPLLIGVATLGLLVNLASAYVLSRGDRSNLNVRAAFLHVLGDALGSVAAIAGGIGILYTGDNRIDPIASCVVAGLVMLGAVRLIRDAVEVLMESAPVDADEVSEALLKEKSVEAVHDVHIWTLTPGLVAMTAHLVVEEVGGPDADALLDRCGKMLEQDFGIQHATLQLETGERCVVPDGQIGCALEQPVN